jgi:hypothetical protein
MFTLQAGQFLNEFTNAGSKQAQGNAIARMVGQCNASLLHRGPVEFTGPVTFAKMPSFGELMSDLHLDGNPAEFEIWDGTPGNERASGKKIEVWPWMVKADYYVPAEVDSIPNEGKAELINGYYYLTSAMHCQAEEP